jgi:voltage-gated potassium channel
MAVDVRPSLRLPYRPSAPAAVLGRRLLAALALIAFVALVAYLGREGYRDGDEEGALTLLDAVYYASVSVTTTGYGDITPVTEGTRLATVLLVTPARILFLILLVGTTVEVLAERSTEAYQRQLWRRRMRDHTIVCGFGTKGRNAISTLIARGVAPERIVVVDADADVVEDATRAGFAAIHGRSTRTTVLEEAGIREAASVVVATDTDESAVLTTLTAREHNKSATIVAAVREAENRHLIHESGADSAIVSSGAAGRLLGLATHSPKVVEVLEDLMSVGTGLDILEREVRGEDVGGPPGAAADAPVIAVVRQGEILRFDDPRAAVLEKGDRLVCLCSHEDAA